ncbi:cobyric acid synthase [Granulicella arctica]|uniref:cobyric acid synthase n=1 Tax=Granulicella arctica TaxID=940613 RepID=UPI0021E042FE|nr:cobyric acid synthase [Granulicella arctica]
MKARAIMVLGTSSHVGKSLLTAALCRIFAQQGYRVAPFKSQNMSLNSAATIEGLEIGRAQALQAEAASIPPSVDMNPILLKPSGAMSSQVVVRGKIWGQLSASDYHLRRVEELMPVVRESYENLAAKNDVIILEGAGSPAEINLKEHDIVNMRIAEMADAQCLLVGDIDRGGVFAALLGTVQLLEEKEQARIAGFIINKFRGDLALLRPGTRMIADRLQKPCLGVVPYISDLLLEEEDSLGLPAINSDSKSFWEPEASSNRLLRIAVISFPSFSNFTDFDALRAEPSVDLHFCKRAEQISYADVVIIPGSKQTVDDLVWLRAKGFEHKLLQHAKMGLIVGICGGMQMLGEQILDPEAMESAGTTYGLGLLPIHTTMKPQKVTSLTTGRLVSGKLFGHPCLDIRISGYEIHIGETTYLESADQFAKLIRAEKSSQISDSFGDGCVAQEGRVIGTYLHGLFDEDAFRHTFLAAARAFYRLSPVEVFDNWQQKRINSLDRLAEEVQRSLDMQEIFSWVGLHYEKPVASTARESLT